MAAHVVELRTGIAISQRQLILVAAAKWEEFFSGGVVK
jgi:hypothetical protein